jgi:starvation-inducible DNA-binding protein
MMTSTKNDLPERIRAEMIDLLNARLADAIDLRLQTKQAHWNVKGPNSIALHELFDQLAEEVDGHADLLAERAVQLGGGAAGTVQAVGQATTLPAYPVEILDGSETIAWLSGAYAAVGKAVREAIEVAAECRDHNTSDIFTEVSRGIDKALWFIEAHNVAST